jgi:uncharacterized protein with FMN-binding domain
MDSKDPPHGAVTVDANRILSVEMGKTRKASHGQIRGNLLIPRILENHSVAVDAVTGATATSNAVLPLPGQP